MKHFILIVLLLMPLTTLHVNAQPNTNRRIVTARVTRAASPAAARSGQEVLTPIQASAVLSPDTESTASQPPAAIFVIDISRSVRRWLQQMRNVATQGFSAAPDNALFGVVAVGSQAEKRLFSARADAITYINSLEATSGYTDLGRGTDSALALLQETHADRAFIIYLTDGRVSLPRNFRDRSDFAAILQREYTQRPNVRVIVINVSDEPMAGIDSLPPNVTVHTLSSWSEAEAVMRNSLAAEIRGQFPTPTPQAATSDNRAVQRPAAGTIYSRVLIGVGILALIALGAVAVLVHRRRRKAVAIGNSNIDTPTNAMRPEDLKAPETEVESEPVVLLEFKGDCATASGTLMKRAVMRMGERVIIGNSAFDTDLAFKHLKQQQCVELRFDGKTLEVFRLRPNIGGEVDDVRLNDEDAPLTFVMGDADEMTIGGLKIHLLFTDDSYLDVLGVTSVQEAVAPSLTVVPDSEPRPVEERRLRRGVSRMNSPRA